MVKWPEPAGRGGVRQVGEMGTRMQVRLLRVLQEGEIRRVGTSSDRKVNVRVISADQR